MTHSPRPRQQPMALACRLAVAVSALTLMQSPAAAAGDLDPAGIGFTSATIQSLVRNVCPRVVQVVVSGYRQTDSSGEGMVVARSRSIGSGVAIGDRGYVVTNAHVVSGA